MMTPKICNNILTFFFSSRRRHTRFDCDWSSDVCSSDLALVVTPDQFLLMLGFRQFRQTFLIKRIYGLRSEERRVGKECRSCRFVYHLYIKYEDYSDNESDHTV